MGEYVVRVSVSDYSAEKKVGVNRYLPAQFKVNLVTDNTYYLPGQKMKGVIHAEYFFDEVVRGAQVKIEVCAIENSRKVLGVMNGVTNKDGVFEFEYQVPSYWMGLPLEKGYGRLFFDVTVDADTGPRESITEPVPVAEEALSIDLIPESGDMVPGVDNIVYVVTAYPDGRAASAVVQYNGQDIPTNALGIGEIKVAGVPFNTTLTHDFSMSLTADDGHGNQGHLSKSFSVRSASNKDVKDSVLLRIDRAVLSAGDMLHGQVFCAQPSGVVYLDVIRNGQTILTKALAIQDRMTEFALDMDESMRGVVEIHAYKILRDVNIVRDAKSIFVKYNNDLKLQISSDKGKYFPGDVAHITLATSKNGKGVPSAVGVNIIDESAVALDQSGSGLVRLYWALEKKLMAFPVIHGLTSPEEGAAEPREMDEAVKVQAEHVLMARMVSYGEFPVIASSRGGNDSRMQAQKNIFFSGMMQIFALFLIILPCAVLMLAVYAYRHQKLMLLADFLRAVILLTGVFLSECLILFSIYSFFSLLGNLSGPLQVVSYCFSPIIPIIMLAMMLTGCIVSFNILIRYARSHNRSLFWVNVAGLSYMLCLGLMVALALIDRAARVSFGENMWGYLVFGCVFAVVYAKYAMDLMKVKKKLAYCAFIMAFVFTQVFLVLVFQTYIKKAVLERFKLPDINPGEPYGAVVNGEKTARVSYSDKADIKKAQPFIRQFSLETFYSHPQMITDHNGKATLDVVMPDPITSWRLTALANSIDGGMGAGDLSLVVARDFMVNIDSPAILTQQDEVAIPVSIYNYLKTPQSVSLTLKRESWFELMDEPVKMLDVEAGEAGIIYFRIKAQQPGAHRLTIVIDGEKKSDVMARAVEVVPVGKRISVSESDILDKEFIKKIFVPHEAIAGSEKLFIKFYPGIFSQIIEGLDRTASMPDGGFDQSLLKIYRYVLGMNYMKAVGKIRPEIEQKAEQAVTAGLQRLLAFEVKEGGFSTFGKGPAEKVVTADGLIAFFDISRVYDIDSRLIPRIQDWLFLQMDHDHWVSDRNYDSAIRIRNNNVAVTSYILWALLDSGWPVQDPRIQKALDYIERECSLVRDNPYGLALAARAFIKGERNAVPLFKRLNDLARKDAGHDTISWRGGVGTNVDAAEITAVVALAYQEGHYRTFELPRMMKFLVMSKDPQGHWKTPRATVLALKALTAADVKSAKGEAVEIGVLIDGKEIRRITINEANRDQVQLVNLQKYARRRNADIKIKFQGGEGLMYQMVLSYVTNRDEAADVPFQESGIKMDLKYDKLELNTGDMVTADVDANYSGGMIPYAVMDIGIPLGFEVQTDGLVSAVKEGLIEKFEVTGRQMMVYLAGLGGKGCHLVYQLKAIYPVKGKTPPSMVYDYDAPDVKKEVASVEMAVR
ncbi:MAG: alpha-2-macroglobulin family protein [Candidatus Omnitrophota bacterium]